MTDYNFCFKCQQPIYRAKSTGRAWQHVDYRQQNKHQAAPVVQVVKKVMQQKGLI